MKGNGGGALRLEDSHFHYSLTRLSIYDSLCLVLVSHGGDVRRLCAWCKKDLPGSNRKSEVKTHGICQTCMYNEAQTSPHFAYAYKNQYGDNPPSKTRVRYASNVAKRLGKQNIQKILSYRKKQKQVSRLVLTTATAE